MKHLVLLIFLSAAAANADPTLVWTEDATPGGVSTSTGIELDQGCTFEGFCGFSGVSDRTFTVSSPGEFVLATSMDVGFSWETCFPFAPVPCGTEEVFSGSASASSTVNGNGFFADANTSQSGTGTCQAVGVCMAGLNLIGFDYDLIYLEVGDYNLELNTFAYGGQFGFPAGSGTFDSILVPYPTTLFITPEPRGILAALAAAFLVLLSLKAKIRPTHI